MLFVTFVQVILIFNFDVKCLDFSLTSAQSENDIKKMEAGPITTHCAQYYKWDLF